MICRYCGKENPDDARLCNYCGTPLSEEIIQNIAPPPVQKTPQQNSQAHTLAILSLIFGIISVTMTCFALYISLGSAIAAIVMGEISLKQQKKKNTYARCGVNLGIIGFGLCTICIVLYIASIIGIFSSFTNNLPEVNIY